MRVPVFVGYFDRARPEWILATVVEALANFNAGHVVDGCLCFHEDHHATSKHAMPTPMAMARRKPAAASHRLSVLLMNKRRLISALYGY
jgi:hypothetical protein